MNWTEIAKEVNGKIKSDVTNENGRFIEVEVTTGARKAANDLLKAAKPKFAHVSNLTMWDKGRYSFTASTRRPALLASSVIYNAGSFGETTTVDVVEA